MQCARHRRPRAPGHPRGLRRLHRVRRRRRGQAAALGFPAARVFVPHPIQDRTDDEMRALADAAVDEIVAAVTTLPGPTRRPARGFAMRSMRLQVEAVARQRRRPSSRMRSWPRTRTGRATTPRSAQEGSTRGQGPGQGHIGPVLPGSHGDRRSTLDVAGDRDVDLVWGVDLRQRQIQAQQVARRRPHHRSGPGSGCQPGRGELDQPRPPRPVRREVEDGVPDLGRGVSRAPGAFGPEGSRGQDLGSSRTTGISRSVFFW